jgi:LAO/AO transport system kinase
MKNPVIKRKAWTIPDIPEMAHAILSGNIPFLSKAITLTESTRPDHRQYSEELIQTLLPHTGNSIRIGITGVPGVGKSSFIEALGQNLIQAGHRLAVLAVDPSSPLSGGSILGDKTRMEQLSRNPNAYIRPTAAGHTLGGVAARTRESVLLCEAAGFSVICIETVGVGQSEVMVREMTDFFLLMMLPGAGDELQGMKKGIVEMADLIVIHKADGEMMTKAKRAQVDYLQALHFNPPRADAWIPEVCLASSLSGEGIQPIWEIILRFQKHTIQNGSFNTRRKIQSGQWFHHSLELLIHNQLNHYLHTNASAQAIQKKALAGEMNPLLAARTIFTEWVHFNQSQSS